jgi:N-acetylglucosamine malate deacetylase 1
MRVLAVVAHPDDEVLGAGGTLARHSAGGDDVHIVCLTDGVGARGQDKTASDRRAAAARRAAEILGANPPRLHKFPDNGLDAVPLLDVTKAIEAVVAEFQPDIVYTHHAGDLNMDHVICHRAVLIACRPLSAPGVRRILAFEVPSSTEWNTPGVHTFAPTRFVDISDTLAVKHQALKAYDEEMRPFPHPRSSAAIDALVKWRGAMAGLAAAEAFVVVREIEA